MTELNERLILGADGGGVKTDIALANGDGEILAQDTFGPTNPNRADGEHPESVLWEAREVLLEEAGMSGRTIDVAVFGLAGVDTADQALEMKRTLFAHKLARTLFVGNDAMLILNTLPDGVGVALKAGTGSIGLARLPDGALHRAGGHGPGYDPGSGQEIGHVGLYEAARYWDGRREPTATSGLFVREVILSAQSGVRMMQEKGALCDTEGAAAAEAFHNIDLKKFNEGMNSLYAPLHQMGGVVLAAVHKQVAPTVLEMASWARTDGRSGRIVPAIPEAYEIANDSASKLCEHITVLARRFGRTTLPLAISGGTLVHNQHYLDLTMQHVARKLPDVTVDGPVIVRRPVLEAVKQGVRRLQAIQGG